MLLLVTPVRLDWSGIGLPVLKQDVLRLFGGVGGAHVRGPGGALAVERIPTEAQPPALCWRSLWGALVRLSWMVWAMGWPLFGAAPKAHRSVTCHSCYG